jgi:hypothetical protein
MMIFLTSIGKSLDRSATGDVLCNICTAFGLDGRNMAPKKKSKKKKSGM